MSDIVTVIVTTPDPAINLTVTTPETVITDLVVANIGPRGTQGTAAILTGPSGPTGPQGPTGVTGEQVALSESYIQFYERKKEVFRVAPAPVVGAAGPVGGSAPS